MVTVLSPIPEPAMRVVALTQSTKVSFSQATPAMIVDTLLGTVMRLVALIAQSRLENVAVSILIGVLLIAAVLGFIIWLGRNPDRFIPRVSDLLTRLPGMRDRSPYWIDQHRFMEKHAGRIAALLHHVELFPGLSIPWLSSPAN
jgi:hypothetical protein